MGSFLPKDVSILSTTTIFMIFSGNCSAGFYCPEGEITPNRLPCTIGHYCPEGSSTPILCNSGEYQDQTQQSMCKTCPGGYYCDNSLGVVTINSSITCPTGYYCPAGKNGWQKGCHFCVTWFQFVFVNFYGHTCL